MNSSYRVKEEYFEVGDSSSLYNEKMFCFESAGSDGGSSSSVQPMEGLHETGPPPFLTKTYDFVDDFSTNHIVSWSSGNNSFVIWDPQAFAITILPRYFKHNNFSSFVRQLNTYGFSKVDQDKWEFANKDFLRGQKHLLKTIKRRRTQSSDQYQDTSSEIDFEVDALRRDKQVLMNELVKLRQENQNSKACIMLIQEKLKRTESTQQHMMNFLARAMQNPNFVQQLVQHKEISKKRRHQIRQETTSFEYEVSDLDRVAMDIQRLRDGEPMQNECRGNRCEDKEIEDEFWEDLLNK